MTTTPTFEEWVHYCFTLGHADFAGESRDPERTVEARERRFCQIDDAIMAAYLTRLFEAPASLLQAYSDQQLADATWFILGTGSQYVNRMMCGPVDSALQTRCVSAMGAMYTDLYEPACARVERNPRRDFNAFTPLETAVYMIWDMDGIDKAVLFPDEKPHLVEPALGVLGTVLTKCRSSACIVSALHAIGHIVMFHSPEHPVVQRGQAMIDTLVRDQHLSQFLLDYAQRARVGGVQ